MAIGFDPSILLSARGIQTPDPMALAQQAMTLGELASRKRLRDEQAQIKAGQDAERAALLHAMPAALRGQFADDVIAQQDPRAIPALLKIADEQRKGRATVDKDTATADKTRAETKVKQLGMIGGGFYELSRNPNLSLDDLASAVERARAIGVDVATLGGMPTDTSPEGLRAYARNVANLTVGAADKIKFEGEAADRQERGRHNLATEGNVVRGQDLTAQTARRGQDISASTAREGQRVTMRGQDLVDARSRDSNAISRENAGGQKLNAETQALAKFIDANSLPSLLTSANALDEQIRKYDGKDIPGVGMTGLVAPPLLSGEGKATRSKVQAVANDLLKLYSGGAVTANEAERRATEMMASGMFTDDDLRNAWPLVKGRIDAAVQNARGGFSPEAINTYEGRGGVKLAPVGSQRQPEKREFDAMPDPAKYSGRRMQAPDGTIYRSDGSRWVRQ